MFQRWLDWFNSATEQSHDKPPNAAALQRHAAASGMVQLGSLTFRLLRLSPHVYAVVRLVDDRFIGYFEQRPVLKVVPEPDVDAELLRAIACAAIRAGKTEWSPESNVNYRKPARPARSETQQAALSSRAR